MSDQDCFSVADLSVTINNSNCYIVKDISLKISPRKVIGIVGESGCGKTTVAMALLGYSRPGTKIVSGKVTLHGTNILELDAVALQKMRGSVISFVPQNPSGSLSPGMPVGQQLREMVEVHQPDSETDAVVKIAWESAQLPYIENILRKFPHQLSGGQQQRVTIAMALICKPSVIVMDEPTTGLDVLTQARLLNTISMLRDSIDVSIVYVSHDLAVVRHIVDSVAVMYGGNIIETGSVDEIYKDPTHPYTRRLLEAVPRVKNERSYLRGIDGNSVGPFMRPSGCQFAPRCDYRVPDCEIKIPPIQSFGKSLKMVRCFKAAEVIKIPFGRQQNIANDKNDNLSDRTNVLEVNNLSAGYYGRRKSLVGIRPIDIVLHDISFDIKSGTCLAVVGESGSGKSTLGRCVAGLHFWNQGIVNLQGKPLSQGSKDRSIDQLRGVQLIFQDADSSLNPSMTVEKIIGRPIRQFFDLAPSEVSLRIAELVKRVKLPVDVINRYPRELSGGERQRVAIARALATKPDLLICDEITSALDVAVQASILELLNELRRDQSLAIMFISHDLAVVHSVSDEVLVLQKGSIVEIGPTANLFSNPKTNYTKELISAAHDLLPTDYPVF